MLDPHAADRLRTELTELPELITRAHLALIPGSGPTGPRVSGATREAPLPCNLYVLSLISPTSADAQPHDTDQTEHPSIGTVIGWAQLVIGERQAANDWTGWTKVPYALQAEATVSVAIRYLLFHHEWTVQREFARGLADDIHRIHAALDRATDYALVGARLRRTVCPRCQGLTVKEGADGRLSCADDDCAMVVTRDEYDARAERVLEEIAAA